MKLSFERKCQLGEETTLGPCLGLCFNKQTCEMYNKGYQKGYAGALAASGTEPGGDGSIAVWDAARGSALDQQAQPCIDCGSAGPMCAGLTVCVKCFDAAQQAIANAIRLAEPDDWCLNAADAVLALFAPKNLSDYCECGTLWDDHTFECRFTTKS